MFEAKTIHEKLIIHNLFKVNCKFQFSLMAVVKLCGDSDTEMLQFPDYWVSM